MPGRKVSDADLRACAAEGLSIAQAARKLGVHDSSIARRAKALGLAFRAGRSGPRPGTGGAPRKLRDPVFEARLRACAAEGLSKAETAARLNMGRWHVDRGGAEMGLTFRDGRCGPRSAPVRRADLLACAEAGMTRVEAAEKLGVSVTTVCRHAERLGVTFPRRRRLQVAPAAPAAPPPPRTMAEAAALEQAAMRRRGML